MVQCWTDNGFVILGREKGGGGNSFQWEVKREKKEKNPFGWEVKRERKYFHHFFGSEKNFFLCFPVVWEVKEKKYAISRSFSSDK